MRQVLLEEPWEKLMPSDRYGLWLSCRGCHIRPRLACRHPILGLIYRLNSKVVIATANRVNTRRSGILSRVSPLGFKCRSLGPARVSVLGIKSGHREPSRKIEYDVFAFTIV